MAHPYFHAVSSAKEWGGVPEDYIELHNWLDASKGHMADFRHRALRHHSQGIFWAEEVFGPTITISTGRVVPIRPILERHVIEDLGHIPTMSDWFSHIRARNWMARVGERNVGREDPPVTAEVAP